MRQQIRDQLKAIHHRVLSKMGTVPGSIDDLSFCTIGLAGEVGEFANLVKKSMRGDPISLRDFRGELADIRVYYDLILYILELDEELIVEEKLRELMRRRPDWFHD